jgi:hypothetical protein
MLWLPRASQMPWSGSRQTRVAHSACDSTIGQRRRGKRSFRRVWSRIESRTAPKTTMAPSANIGRVLWPEKAKTHEINEMNRERSAVATCPD